MAFVILSIVFFWMPQSDPKPINNPGQAKSSRPGLSPAPMPESPVEIADKSAPPESSLHDIENRAEIPGNSGDLLISNPIKIAKTEEFIATKEINPLPETRNSNAGRDSVTESHPGNLLAPPDPDTPKQSGQTHSMVIQAIESAEKPLKTAGAGDLATESSARERSPISNIQATAIREHVFPARFAFSSSRLKKISKQDLASINNFLADCGKELAVVGQTCDIGPNSYNRTLGLARANAVKRFLMTRTQFDGSFTLFSEGAENPALPNSSEQNRGLNRRVVLRCFQTES